MAVVLNKKPKAEARVRRDKQKEEPSGPEAAKKTKAGKAAKKKTTSKRTASPSAAAVSDGGSTKAKAVPQTKKATVKRAGGHKPGQKVGKRRTIRVSEEIEPCAAALDPFEVAKQKMKGSVPAIVDAMVELAKQGSCSHAKTLLEMTGAKHMFGGETEAEDHGEPWAKLVLERMDEAEQESLKEDLPEVVAEP